MNVLSLFAGIGGLDLGLERAGMTVVGQVEIDPFCQRVLAKHWPEVPRHDDVRTAVAWWLGRARPAVDVVCGGFPCQPVSTAGERRGRADRRWLWPAMATVIEALRPEWVIGENVPGLRTLGLADVLRDLDRIGYRARAGTITACAVGAPHTRERMFILAHTVGESALASTNGSADSLRTPAGTGRSRVDGGRAAGRDWWSCEPRLARVAYGVPRAVDRRRALGNAVVPQVAEHVGRMVMAAAS